MITKVCFGLAVGLVVGIFMSTLMAPQQTSAQQPGPPLGPPMEMRGMRVVTGEQMIDLSQRGPSGESTFAVLDPESKTVTVFRSSGLGSQFAPLGAPLRYGPVRPSEPPAPR